eukprot:g12091.t1
MMSRLSAVAVVATTGALASQASAMSSSGSREAYKYLGCFHDRKDDRVLGDMLRDSDLTTEVCLDYCTRLGAAFMATQWGFECWCSPDGGLDYNRHYDMVGEDAVCDMPCMGDETEMCGGYDSFDLYKLDPGSSECSTPVEAYEQCGGDDWAGSTCCADGYECVDVSQEGCYSQCRPVSTEEETPPPTAPATSMEAPTPAPAAMDRRTAAPVTEMPVMPDVPPTPSPVAPETPPPVPAPTEPPVAPETPSPVPAPTEPPVAPRTPAPEPATEEPVTPPTTPTGSTPADMVDILELHNEARCIHNADPMTWDGAVEASAAVHAKRMSDRCSGLFHSESEERNGFGENIYWCGNSPGCYSAESAMNGFYNEEIQTDSVTGYGGHATQILWKSSKKLGCAVSSCTSGSRPGDYLACQYDPPGNYMGRLEEEVDLPTNAGNC